MKATMTFSYCPQCGKQQSVKKLDDTNYECQSCQWHLWNNAKATVALAFIKDGKMLVSKRALEPKKGYYDLPGGFVDFGESAKHAAIREAKEETAVYIDESDLSIVEVYFNRYFEDISTVDIVFLVSKWRGDFTAQDDSAGLEWKPFDFVHDSRFCPPYAGLDKKLTAIAQTQR